nr:unnamed protein product [Callosobruchus analis]
MDVYRKFLSEKELEEIKVTTGNKLHLFLMPSEVNAALYALEVKIGREEIIASNEEKFVCRAPLCHLCFLYSIKMNKKFQF